MEKMTQFNSRFSNPYSSQYIAKNVIESDIQQQKHKQNYPSHRIIISEDNKTNRIMFPPEKTKLAFQGFAFQFELFLREQKRQNLINVQQAQINLLGIEIKKINRCVPFCCGFLAAYIYCLCNCLFCCNCRQKIVYTLYQVHQLGYQNIVRLVQACPGLIVLKLKVKDNNLNESKASVLSQALKMGTVKRFQLTNQALGVSIQPDKSFEDFAFNYKKLKQLKVQSTIKWQDIVVI